MPIQKRIANPKTNENYFRGHLYTEFAYSKTDFEPQGDDRSLERHCGQGNRPMSFRGVKRRGNPLNRNKNRLTIATNRISPHAYYRTENLRYQFEQGQELLPQLRQIICLVEVGRDTHTRLNYILPSSFRATPRNLGVSRISLRWILHYVTRNNYACA